MSEHVTVDEARALRDNLEVQIKEQLLIFERRTGMRVVDVLLLKVESASYGSTREEVLLVGVDVGVEL
jgi:hypothetical protein